MSYPNFYHDVACITLHDPLAEFLGATDDGQIEYGYVDAVKLAGHSCPTVAGAYLMTLKAFRWLYPDALPERGGVRVEFGAPLSDGVTGVIAAVTGLLTGAAGEGGFKGLAGRFGRRNLLAFEAGNFGDVRYTRLDSGARVALAYHPEIVPTPSGLPSLMSSMLTGAASEAERTEFGRLWQMRVKHILIDYCDDPALVVCRGDPSVSDARSASGRHPINP
jgi:hypothetical protein